MGGSSTEDGQLPVWERIAWPALASAMALIVWTVAVRWSGTLIFPSPLDVARGLLQLAEKGLLGAYIGDSLWRVAAGYTLAVVVGIPLGLLLGWSSSVARAVNPLIELIRPISPIAWMPLAVIWFGISDVAPIFLIFLASFFPIVTATASGVRDVPPMYLQAGRNFGLSTARLMRSVVIPAVLPRIVIGLRIAFGVAWLVLVAAEMIAVDSGLGYLIIDARNAGKRYDLVVGGMLLIGLIGLILDTIMRRAEAWAVERR
ncbi:MAG: ABC transporter permease [Thermoanaerobaculia bacterium]